MDHTSLKIEKITGESDDFLDDHSPIKDVLNKVHDSAENKDDSVNFDNEEEKSSASLKDDD